MDAEQRTQKTLDGNSDAPASVLRPNVEGLYSLIPLTQGQFAIVDPGNYECLKQYKWYALKMRNAFYAVRPIGKWPNQQMILMHRQIMNTPKGMETDHRNHNTLDNRIANLRICTHSNNQYNRKIPRTGTSKFKGVSWHKTREKWMVCIQKDKKTIHLGRFDNEIKAAMTYDKKAKEIYGAFACPNF